MGRGGAAADGLRLFVVLMGGTLGKFRENIVPPRIESAMS